MPEAPEVEAVVRALRPVVQGRTIRSARVVHRFGVGRQIPATFLRRVCGQRIQNVFRRGKYLLLELTRGTLVVHFKFDGQLLFFDNAPPCGTHVDVLLKLDSRNARLRRSKASRHDDVAFECGCGARTSKTWR